MSRSDRRLVRRLLRGDEEAFEEFFDGHFPGLYRFALSRVRRDPDAAEEVAQAALCKAMTKLGTYRGEASLFTWLCTFCRHEISAHHRRLGRQPRTFDLVEDRPEALAALESLWTLAEDDPEGAARRAELQRLVHVVLDRLPARYADALEWKYIDGLPVRDIAVRLGLRLKATESVLTRARRAFRDGFEELTRSLGPAGPGGPSSP